MPGPSSSARRPNTLTTKNFFVFSTSPRNVPYPNEVNVAPTPERHGGGPLASLFERRRKLSDIGRRCLPHAVRGCAGVILRTRRSIGATPQSQGCWWLSAATDG